MTAARSTSTSSNPVLRGAGPSSVRSFRASAPGGGSGVTSSTFRMVARSSLQSNHAAMAPASVLPGTSTSKRLPCRAPHGASHQSCGSALGGGAAFRAVEYGNAMRRRPARKRIRMGLELRPEETQLFYMYHSGPQKYIDNINFRHARARYPGSG